MKEKFRKISRWESVTLLLTVLFAAGTLLWFHLSEPEEGLTLVTATETGRVLEAPDQPAAPGMLEGERLNLNTASPADLTRLPGIGEKKAEAIAAWREAHGPFRVVEDLLAVDGIGEKLLEEMRPYVTVGEPAVEGGT